MNVYGVPSVRSGEAVQTRVSSSVVSLLDPMFCTGLSQSLIKTLSPAVLKTLQEQLRRALDLERSRRAPQR